MSVRAGSPVLVGRAEHLATLGAALDRARSGGPSAVLLGGEAGVGKSRLLSEFAAQARRSGARVLTGGCLDLGADGLPFAPFAGMLRELVRDLGADGVAALLPGHATREFARLLPEFGDAGGEADAAVARARLFEQMLSLLERIAENGPVALIIEDAHWADRSTRELTAFLVGSQRILDGVLIVVSYRSDEMHRSHPLRSLLAELSRLAWVERMDLPRLGRAHADELAARIIGRELDPWLADEVHQRAEGNPLFVEELLCCDGGLSAELPESLRDLVLASVRRLPEESQELLRAASPAGQRFGHGLLVAVTGLGDDDLARALRPAVAANVLTADDGGYVFRHALIREAIYDDLLPGERTRLHTRFAAALGSDPGLVASGRAMIEEAHHWYHAHDTPEALTSAWQAAAEAGRVLAHAEQLALLARVLELWDKVPDAAQRIGAGRLAALEQAVACARHAGQHERGIAFVSAALRAADPATEPVRVALLLEARATLSQHAAGADAGAVAADLRAALDLVPPGVDDAARARVLVSEASCGLDTQDPRTSAHAEEALALARQAGDVTTQATSLCELALLASHSGDNPAALRLLADARSLAEGEARYPEMLRVAICESRILEGLGEHERAAQVARAGIARARDYGLARTTGTFLAINVAEPLVSLGHWDQADEVIQRALAHSPPPVNRFALRLLAADIALRRGDLAAARAAAPAMAAAPAGTRLSGQHYLPLAQLDVGVRLAEGRESDALAATGAAVDRYDLSHNPRYAWPLLVTGARACAAVLRAPGRDRAAASRASEQLGRLQALADTMPAVGPVQHAHQVTFEAEAGGRPTDTPGGPQAVARWDAAASAWQRVAQPYERAVATRSAAEAALAAGDRVGATERLRRAAEAAAGLGARPLREGIEALARSARIGLSAGRAGPGSAGEGRLGLTAREFEVLRLVAAGRSNPEIAAELFISAKTASVHVSNILAKLDVGSRGEAAAAAHRLGLFTSALAS